jgi:hypothetical protein
VSWSSLSRQGSSFAAALLLSAALLICGAGPVQAATEPLAAPFFGIYTEDPLGPLPEAQSTILRAQAESGAGLIRTPFNWPSIEPTKGQFDWGPYDWLVDASAQAGLALLPTLQNSPSWATSEPAGSTSRGAFPPRNPADFGRFAAAAVRRYGSGGTFWADHPWTPYRPIRAWQAWNEPNIPYFWPAGPNPSAYTALLTATARSIRAADPQAIVVSAGITNSAMGISQESFVAGMYRAGARGQFDVLAIHPYAADAHSSLELLEAARSLMDENGDDSPIWATELAWASGGEGSRFTTDEAGQADRISAFLHAASAERERLGLAGVILYDWRDSVSSLPGPGAWPSRSGLLRLDGSPKPALFAFRDAVHALLHPGQVVPPADQGTSEPGASENPAGASPGGAAEPSPPRGARPQALLRVSGRRAVRVRRDGAVPVTVSCALARCEGRIRLERPRARGGRVIARVRFSLAANTRRTLHLPLNGTGWHLLGRARSIAVRPAAAGVALTHARGLRVLPPHGWRG